MSWCRCCSLVFGLGVDRGIAPPVLLVCEEAHRYVPQDEVARIRADQARDLPYHQGREGRKYGVTLGLVARPL